MKINSTLIQLPRPGAFAICSVVLVFYIGLSGLVSAQNELTIKGKVVDENQEALPGASIQLKGTTIGTVTDVDGNYTLEVPDANGTLVFSFIGYLTENISISGRNVIDISLSSDITELTEVVVVGYGQVNKKKLTGAVSSVNSEELSRTTPTSIQDALQGKVSGVQIIANDGAPGSGVQLRVRGANTLTAGSQPLYVVDGFPLEQVAGNDSSDPFNPLATINPNDIKSIEVLKDASAAAIYGSRGSNGVILITTKSGRTGKPKVSFSNNIGISYLPGNRIPEMMGPEAYARLQFQRSLSNAMVNGDVWQRRIEQRYWESDTVDVTDWLDEITRVAYSQQSNISLSGGSESTTYNLSFGYNNEDGIIDQSNFERYSLRLNLNQKIGRRVEVGFNGSYSNARYSGIINDWRDGNAINQALFTNPFIPRNFVTVEDITDTELNTFFDQRNPINEINDSYIEKDFKTFYGKVFLKVQVVDDLEFQTSYGIGKQLWNRDYFFGRSVFRGRQENIYAEINDDDLQNWVLENRLTYDKSFFKHHISATSVFEMQRRTQNVFSLSASNIPEENVPLGIFGIRTGTVNTPLRFFQPVDDALVSLIGRVSYDYDQKYVASISVRSDGSSKFPVDNRWAVFPAIGLAWNADEENFIKNIRAISQLKLRASYGVTGNQQIPPYQSVGLIGESTAQYNLGSGAVFGKEFINFPNPDLKWEVTQSYDAGLDIGFFTNRITASVDYYYKYTTDLLLEEQIDPIIGAPNNRWIRNIGELEIHGLDFTLNTVNKESKDFSWTSSLILSGFRSKILDLGSTDVQFYSSTNRDQSRVNRSGEDEVILRVGDPVGIYYGYVQGGVLNSYGEVASQGQNSLSIGVGGFSTADLNGDGIINNEDRVPLAYTAPLFTGSISNTIKFRNFEFFTFFRGSYGNDIVNANITFAVTGRSGNNSLQQLDGQYWSAQNPDAQYARADNTATENYLRSEFVEDGSFLRLETARLSYNLPERTLDKLKLSSAQVFITGTNLFLLTRYSWFDPEVNSTWGTAATVGFGKDQGGYPRARTFRIGFNLNF